MLRVLVVGVLLSVLAAGAAQAHIERTAYWPDPRPDTSVSPPAGGKVPKARSLKSALSRRGPGQTRVVCQSDSIKRLRASLAAARRDGYVLRPSQPRLHVSRKAAKSLLALNRKLVKRCSFHDVQPAVVASHNNDRVVIMPGVYTEEASRRVAALPPECDRYRTTSEK